MNLNLTKSPDLVIVFRYQISDTKSTLSPDLPDKTDASQQHISCARLLNPSQNLHAPIWEICYTPHLKYIGSPRWVHGAPLNNEAPDMKYNGPPVLQSVVAPQRAALQVTLQIRTVRCTDGCPSQSGLDAMWCM